MKKTEICRKDVPTMLITTDQCSFSFHCLSSGQFVGKEGWVHPRRQLDAYEILYMIQGEASIQEELTPFTLEKGDVLVLSPELVHFGLAPSEQKVSFFWMHFTTDKPDLLGLTPSCQVHAENDMLPSLFRQLLHLCNDKDYPPEAADLAALLIVTETAVLQQNAAVRHRKILRDITEWVRLNVCAPITAAQVGDKFGYNSDYLTALFKENFGMGLKEYINEQKMKRAEEYLLTTDAPIKEIASLLGFGDANRFIKYFTYHQGISPAKFRSQYYSTGPRSTEG